MISKNRLRELSAYRRQQCCDEQAVFVVEGDKLVSEALASGFTMRVLCGTGEWLEAHAGLATAAEVFTLTQAELERISGQRSPNGAWALMERSVPQVAEITASPLVLALDRLQDPGNMGTLMRTADWYGVRRIVCSGDTVSCYNAKVVQASMGAIFRTVVEYVDLPQWLADCGMPVYGASLGGRPVDEVVPPTGAAVLLVGNESRGISAEAMARVDEPVVIPNRGGTAESLNAAVAAAILLDRLSTTK